MLSVLWLALFNEVLGSSYWWIHFFFNAGESFSFYFLDLYNLPLPSLGCKTFCIVINFLVLWSICLSSSFIHFKNGPKYLARGTAAEFGFEKLFLSSPLVWLCPLPIFPSSCNFPFLQVFWFFLVMAVLFLPLIVFFHFSFSWHIFQYQIIIIIIIIIIKNVFILFFLTYFFRLFFI